MESTQIEQRLAAIEARLNKIDGGPKPAVPVATPTSAPVSAASSATPDDWEFEPVVRNTPIPPKTAYVVAEPEEATPGNWLGIIAVICFVMAAGFIVKLSIDTGWLTPTRQIGLAALFGFSLIGAGLALLRADRDYASLLPGAGVIVLYLTVFAAHRFYSIIPFEAALGLTVAVSGICIWLYSKIRNDIYPITAAIGAYVAPVVLGLHAEAVFSLYYFLLCSIAFATISIFLCSRTLMLLAAYLSIAVTSLVGLNLGQDSLIASVLVVHFLIFSVDSYIYTQQTREPLSEAEAWCFMPALLFFYAMEYYLIDHIHPGLAPWISLVFAGFLIGLYLLAKRNFPDSLGSQSLILIFTTVVAFHSVYLELMPDYMRPWLFVVILAGGSFIPASFAKRAGNDFFLPVLALLAVVGIEYLAMLYHLTTGYGVEWVGVSLAAVASLWFVWFKADDGLVSRASYGHLLLGAAHLLAIPALYRLSSDMGSLAVSASWLFYAVVVMIFSVLRKDEMVAKSALYVLAFAAGKALLYDAASAPTVVRIFCLMLTGAVLYGCGFFMRKVAGWAKRP